MRTDLSPPAPVKRSPPDYGDRELCVECSKRPAEVCGQCHQRECAAAAREAASEAAWDARRDNGF